MRVAKQGPAASTAGLLTRLAGWLLPHRLRRALPEDLDDPACAGKWYRGRVEIGGKSYAVSRQRLTGGGVIEFSAGRELYWERLSGNYYRLDPARHPD